MSLFDIRDSFVAMDAPSILLALLLAVIALYLGNVVGGIVDAIAHEEAGLKEPIGDERSFADLARKPEFILLLVTAAGAARGVSYWTSMPLCLAGLSIARLPKYIRLWPRATEIGAQWQVLLAVSASSILSLVSAACMFLIGACAGWLFR